MSTSRLLTSVNARCKAPVSRSANHPAPRTSKVLAERNQAVVAVGAWVEGGQDFVEHPSALALLTEEIQADRRRENEESLQRFQDEVRHRVARQAQASKKRQQLKENLDRRIPHQQYQVWTHRAPVGEMPASAGGTAAYRVLERGCQESREGMRQVRLRLAACRLSPHEEMTPDLPGGEWKVSPTRHKPGVRVEWEDAGEEEEEEEAEGDVYPFTSQHECPLVQQKGRGPAPWDSDNSPPDPCFQPDLTVPRVLWPLTDPDELKRKQKSQFLMHRRLCMNTEREHVKENEQHRKHLKRTARIKAEKEQHRLEEERKLERVRELIEARQRLQEREQLIAERLRLEEEERAAKLQRKKKEDKGKEVARFMEALRAQMKERLSQEKLELPPLCYCASTFWDSHPDTCANNCVFHNNPKAYTKALHSTMLSLDL